VLAAIEPPKSFLLDNLALAAKHAANWERRAAAEPFFSPIATI
jgi:hypothetical protein